jgi:hypothetical protein
MKYNAGSNTVNRTDPSSPYVQQVLNNRLNLILGVDTAANLNVANRIELAQKILDKGGIDDLNLCRDVIEAAFRDKRENFQDPAFTRKYNEAWAQSDYARNTGYDRWVIETLPTTVTYPEAATVQEILSVINDMGQANGWARSTTGEERRSAQDVARMKAEILRGKDAYPIVHLGQIRSIGRDQLHPTINKMLDQMTPDEVAQVHAEVAHARQLRETYVPVRERQQQQRQKENVDIIRPATSQGIRNAAMDRSVPNARTEDVERLFTNPNTNQYYTSRELKSLVKQNTKLFAMLLRTDEKFLNQLLNGN